MSMTLGNHTSSKHEVFWAIIWMLLLVVLANRAFGQELPNAPEPQFSGYVHNDFSQEQPKRRGHRADWVTLAAVNLFAVTGNQKDIKTSEECFHEYGYIEGNTWLVGTRPSMGRYWTIDGLMLLALNTPSLVAHFKHSRTWFYAGLVGPAAFGLKHLQQGYDNEKTLEGLR